MNTLNKTIDSTSKSPKFCHYKKYLLFGSFLKKIDKIKYCLRLC